MANSDVEGMIVEPGADCAAGDDRALLAQVRAGAEGAFAELFARHADAVRRFAIRCAPDRAEAEDMAAEAFFRVLQAVRRGSGPEGNVRGYLLTVVRHLAAEWGARRRDVPVADDELSRLPEPEVGDAVSRVDQHLIARAFASLPQRWRSVLWQVEVEGKRPAAIARHFGLSANATAALARRARKGLCVAYLQAHVAPSVGPASCRTVIDRLGSYTTGGLRDAEIQRIRAHLANCVSCQAVHVELADVCAGLRRYTWALTPPALTGAAVAVHHPATAKVAMLFGKVTAYGTRLKVGVAATSMVVAGGLGAVAVPLFAHFTSDNQANGDMLEIAVPSARTSAADVSGTAVIAPPSATGELPASLPAADVALSPPSLRRDDQAGTAGVPAAATASDPAGTFVPVYPAAANPPAPTYEMFAGSAEPPTEFGETEAGRQHEHRTGQGRRGARPPTTWSTTWTTVWTSTAWASWLPHPRGR